ncbi:SCO family protein [Rhizobium grahamii]|uniref:Electron transport protein SCO1/SenC n=1 Tax=Rhizobium grahamii CCGE 502 TaxID=990285 RepID=S3HAE8_9HYPH|nr:SCO family protein [Rhizobium grahamii]EPE95140.1 electron transport protein SCO1/SenC [Rhizobium grahamii CCGE 502]
MKRWPVAMLTVAAVLSALCGGAATAGSRWGKDYFPNVEVVTQNGERVRFYDDLIKGKIVLISFIFTSCTDLCPLTTARITQVVDRIQDQIGKTIFVVSITVDPENDTPEKMKAFADAFYKGPGWTFITGKPDDIRAINAKLGNKSDVATDHRNEIVLGNDNTGEWARNSPFADIENVELAVRDMDPAWREGHFAPMAALAPATDHQGLTLDREPGQVLFKKICAPCHTVGVGDRIGPDLLDVTVKRDQEWLKRMIMNPVRLRAEKDPTLAELDARFQGVRMPYLGMSASDATDLISYLATKSAEIADLRAQPEATHVHRHDDAAENHDHGGMVPSNP